MFPPKINDQLLYRELEGKGELDTVKYVVIETEKMRESRERMGRRRRMREERERERERERAGGDDKEIEKKVGQRESLE